MKQCRTQCLYKTHIPPGIFGIFKPGETPLQCLWKSYHGTAFLCEQRAEIWVAHKGMTTTTGFKERKFNTLVQHVRIICTYQ